MSQYSLPLSQRLWRSVQACTVRVVMRVLHAGFYELARSDSRARSDMRFLPEGCLIEIRCFNASPRLMLRVEEGVLIDAASCQQRPLCSICLKSLGIAFRLFTGQLGLASGNAQHAFTVQGDVAATMALTRLICLTEAYLFPSLIASRVLVELPRKETSALWLYVKIAWGFLTFRY